MTKKREFPIKANHGITCPKCRNTHTNKYGKIRNQQRYRCMKCEHQFVVENQ